MLQQTIHHLDISLHPEQVSSIIVSQNEKKKRKQN